MLNDMSFCFYYKMQGIKSVKMNAKLERTFSTALQNKTKKNTKKHKKQHKTSAFLSHSQNLYVDEGSDKKTIRAISLLNMSAWAINVSFFSQEGGAYK